MATFTFHCPNPGCGEDHLMVLGATVVRDQRTGTMMAICPKEKDFMAPKSPTVDCPECERDLGPEAVTCPTCSGGDSWACFPVQTDDF